MAYRWPLDRGPHQQVMGGTILFFHLPPVCCSLGLPFHQAICLKVGFRHIITSVARFGSHRHKISGHELKLWIRSFFMGTKALARNNINYLIWHGCLLIMLQGNPFIHHQWGSFTNVGMPLTREKGNHLPPRTTKLCNLRNSCNSITVPTVNQIQGFSSRYEGSCSVEPTQGHQKCDRSTVSGVAQVH